MGNVFFLLLLFFKFKFKIIQPAALLAESLSQPSSNDGGSFGMELADFMAAMVVLSVSKIGIATLGLAPGGIG